MFAKRIPSNLKAKREQLRAAAAQLYPYPIHGNTFDMDDFKLRCKKVNNERRLYVIRNL